MTRRLKAALGDLRSIAPPDRVGVIDRQLALLEATVAAALDDDRDIDLALAEDGRGIGVAASAK